MGTHPDLQSCIINTLEYGGPSEFAREATDPSVGVAAMIQDEIGWENFLFGRIATEWRRIQAEHYRDTSSKRTVKRWASGLVLHLLAICHGVWMSRNGVVHARDESGRLLADVEAVDDEIRTQFDVGTDGLYPGDQHFLTRRSLKKVLKDTLPNKRLWVECIQECRLV